MLLVCVDEECVEVSVNIIVAGTVNAIPKVDCRERHVGCGSGRVVGGNAIAKVGRRETSRRSKCANGQGRERKWQKKGGDQHIWSRCIRFAEANDFL